MEYINGFKSTFQNSVHASQSMEEISGREARVGWTRAFY